MWTRIKRLARWRRLRVGVAVLALLMAVKGVVLPWTYTARMRRMGRVA